MTQEDRAARQLAQLISAGQPMLMEVRFEELLTLSPNIASLGLKLEVSIAGRALGCSVPRVGAQACYRPATLLPKQLSRGH